jgi:5-dehydro-2-deoxygluconokinase
MQDYDWAVDMALRGDDIDETLIAEARLVLATGTHLSDARTEAAVLKALKFVHKDGVKTALDIELSPQSLGCRRPR